MIKLYNIPTSNVDAIWRVVVGDIANALARSNNYALVDHFKKWIKEEKMQLWILWDHEAIENNSKYYGVVVTEIVKRKLIQSCNIFIVTGRQRQQWQHLISVLEDFALKNNCTNMELIARKGWTRIMKQFQYNQTHVVLEKPITQTEKENN